MSYVPKIPSITPEPGQYVVPSTKPAEPAPSSVNVSVSDILGDRKGDMTSNASSDFGTPPRPSYSAPSTSYGPSAPADPRIDQMLTPKEILSVANSVAFEGGVDLTLPKDFVPCFNLVPGAYNQPTALEMVRHCLKGGSVSDGGSIIPTLAQTIDESSFLASVRKTPAIVDFFSAFSSNGFLSPTGTRKFIAPAPKGTHQISYPSLIHFIVAHVYADDWKVVMKVTDPRKVEQDFVSDHWARLNPDVLKAGIAYQVKSVKGMRNKLSKLSDRLILYTCQRNPVLGTGRKGDGQNLLGRAYYEIAQVLKDQPQD